MTRNSHGNHSDEIGLEPMDGINFLTKSDQSECWAEVVQLWKEALDQCSSVDFHIVLGGGKTPLKWLSEVARSLEASQKSKHFFWLSDERYVPEGHKDHNGSQLREFLVRHWPTEFDILEFDTSLSIEGAACRYSDLIESKLAERSFDLCFLGLGPDGHTASLFPNFDDWDSSRFALPTGTGIDGRERLSMTPYALAQSKKILLIAVGEEKRIPLKRIFFENDQSLPMARLTKYLRELLVITDQRM